MNNNINKKQKIRGIFSLIIIVVFFAAIAALVGRPLIQMASEPNNFRDWIDSFGFWGRLIFIGAMVLQNVIAIIPGEPLEICAGYAFGTIEGTLLCIAASVIGSVIVFLFVRTYGMRFVELFFDKEKLGKLKFLHNTKKLNLFVFIFTVIPGTPKDMMSYFVGLTSMKLSTWIFITAVGRIPSIITSTIGGDVIGKQKYITAVIVFAITLLISLGGIILYKYLCKKMNKDN